jgi:hypothetical protein
MQKSTWKPTVRQKSGQRLYKHKTQTHESLSLQVPPRPARKTCPIKLNPKLPAVAAISAITTAAAVPAIATASTTTAAPAPTTTPSAATTTTMATSAAISAATCAASAAATRAGAFSLRPSFIDDQIPPAEVLTVQGINRTIGIFVVGNFNECEAARLPSKTITN